VLVTVRLGRDLGITAGRMVAAYAISVMVAVSTGATAGLLCVPVAGGGAWWALALAVLAVLGAIWPGWVNRVLRLALRLVRRPGVTVAASAQAMRRSMVTGLASWLVSGIHLWLLAMLFGAPPLLSLPVCVGAFALATTVGSLAFLLPDGWGARELVLVVPLATVLPLSAATVVVVASRVVWVLAEVSGAALVLAWTGLRASRRTGPALATDGSRSS
jgi:hypothetical protein